MFSKRQFHIIMFFMMVIIQLLFVNELNYSTHLCIYCENHMEHHTE